MISKQEFITAILAFDKSFKAMSLPAHKSQRAQDLIDKFKAEAQDEKLQAVAFAAAVRYFFNFFSRELMPGGITLSPEASKDWNEIRQLANSFELLNTINSPIPY